MSVTPLSVARFEALKIALGVDNEMKQVPMYCEESFRVSAFNVPPPIS